MKKRVYLFLSLLGIATMTACGKTKEEAANPIPPVSQETESVELGTKEEKTEVPALLYFGNNSADGLMTEEVMIRELTAENIIQSLAKKNIVSLDTKVKGFQIIEKEDEVILDLNLSKEFKEYVGMMGTAGEYIIIAGLTNTFIDAFSGTSLVLNVEGMPLETGHNSYQEPLVKYPLTNKSIEMTYELTEEKIQDEIYQVSYPQFTKMEDTDFMKKWNTMIKEEAMGNYSEEGMTSYTVEYEIATLDVELVSIVFRGTCNYENAAYPFNFAKTINIDLKTGNSKRLSEYADIDAIVKRIQEGSGFTILSEGITAEDLANYMQNEYVEDFSILLFDYDYDNNNKSLIPTGYSYIKENKPVLVINVMHAMGDYVEVQIDK